MDSLDLASTVLSGKELTVKEVEALRNHNRKYELVRALYIEKMNHEGAQLTNFHFSPGENFDSTPVIDSLNELLRIFNSIKTGDYEVLDFDDPPNTGLPKTNLKGL